MHCSIVIVCIDHSLLVDNKKERGCHSRAWPSTIAPQRAARRAVFKPDFRAARPAFGPFFPDS
ncbi:hypothetical protein DM50_3354 [Burkholderia mallei]|nr:hypothetical protein DP43_4880 [Burkholderia pseudomallei]KOT02634.1 hypothetical protein DM50_3354 [Burkholderia mallei]